MSQKHVKSRHTAAKEPSKAVSALSSLNALGNTVVIRLVLATVIFAVSLIISMPDFVSIILLVLAAAAAGYDIVMEAVSDVENGRYLATSVVVVVVSVIAFFIGFAIEGAAVVLLYQIGQLLLNYAKDHTEKAALELLAYQDEEVTAKVKAAVEDKNAASLNIHEVMLGSSGSVLKVAVFLALAYAIALPIFTNYSYIVSVHRALMIILIATPMSIVVSIPLSGIVGLCYSAQQGVVFNNTKDLEGMADANIAIFDKAGIFADECPRIIAMYSDVLDSATFMNFVAHAVYYSEQPVAKAIAAAYDQEYHLDVIKDFRDIPGYGVELSIDGIDVVFAEKDFLASRGVQLPEDSTAIGQVFYMVVAGKVMGKVVISSDVNDETENLVPEMKAVGISRCILLTDDSKEAGQQFAELMNFNEMYPQCSGDKRLEVISDISSKAKTNVIFVYASGIECHSPAAIDMRVGKKSKYADAIVDHEYINNIPFARQVAVRVREIAIENALFAFIVKALLIFLSIVGYCNLWFAIFIDFVAAVATILNTIRVTSESLITTLKYKSGK